MAARASSRHIPWWVPFFNPIAWRLLAVGVPMGPNGLITVRGRRSGLPRTTPITIVETLGRRWVLAPFGDVNWVHNLRAAGRATITQRRRKEEVAATELAPAEVVVFFRDVLAPLVRRYGWLAMWIVRTIDKIDIDDPLEAARGRPVFELHRSGG